MARKIEDLSGRKFGLFTVMKYEGRSNSNKPLFRCLCDCGKESVVIGASLKSGKTNSCGCLQTAKSQFKKGNKLGELKRKDLHGVRINGLEFLNYVRSENSKAVWLLKCHCGNKFERVAASIESGNTTSCGCLSIIAKNRTKRDKAIENGCFFGVRKSGKGFSSFIRKNNSRMYIGQFKTELEAARAYDKKAIELYGENAILNFPPELEDSNFE